VLFKGLHGNKDNTERCTCVYMYEMFDQTARQATCVTHGLTYVLARIDSK
jgi:hypothetical protein